VKHVYPSSSTISSLSWFLKSASFLFWFSESQIVDCASLNVPGNHGRYLPFLLQIRTATIGADAVRAGKRCNQIYPGSI
jgi:hypothetical protein